MNNPFQSALGRTPACPPLESLENPAFKQHVDSCPHCRTELTLMHEFESAEPRPHELGDVEWIENQLLRRGVVQPANPSLWVRMIAWINAPAHGRAIALVAASLLIVVAATFFMQQDSRLHPPTGPAAVILRSGTVKALSPVGEITETPAQLRWEPVPDAVSYQVTLMEVDGTVVWSGDTNQTLVDFPNNVSAQLKPGRAFQWQVTARSESGAQISTSNLQRFHILLTQH